MSFRLCFREALIYVLFVLVCGLVIETIRWERDTHKRTNAILVHLDVAVGRLQATMGQVEAASRQQQEVSSRTLAILDHTDQLTVRATTAIAQLQQTVAQLGDSGAETFGALKETTVHLNGTADALTAAVQHTDASLNSAEVHQSLANLSAATGELVSTTKEATRAATQLDGTVSDLHAITTHYRQQVMAPVNATRRALGWLTEFSAAVAAKLVP